MTRWIVAFVGAAAAMAVVAGVGTTTGCTLSPTASDAGADAGTQTVGDQCAMISTAQCGAYAGCAQAAPDDCIENMNAGCCSGATCDEISQTSADAVEACVDAYTMDPDCYALSINTAPSACSGIPQPP
jgi:hypothetical protein